MSIAHLLITRHCHNQLKARGWPDNMEVCSNLSYSQGDGVAFYGHVDNNALSPLLSGLQQRGHLSEPVQKELEAAMAGSELSVDLKRNDLANRYAHAGTISVQIACLDCREEVQERFIGMLMRAIREEIRDICGTVAADGYRLLDAITPSASPVVFERKTRHFRVRAVEVERDIDVDEHWHDETLDTALADILNEGAILRSLEISVICRTTELVLSAMSIYDVTRRHNQPVWAWFSRHWSRQVVLQARVEIQMVQAAFSNVRQVA